ncbi:MAG: DNA-processing protein DprA [Saprospiraceae bacterium]
MRKSNCFLGDKCIFKPVENTLEKIALTLVEGVGPVTSRQLIAYLGGAQEVFKAKKKDLIAIPGIGEKTIASLVDHKASFLRAEEELAFIEKHEIKTLFYTDKQYPFRLKVLEDSPILLYFKGNTDLDHHRIIAVIGTRSPSDMGRMNCEKIIDDLFAYDVLIVSGLAYGVDITAHRKCVEMNIPTIGVMGNGMDKLYPGAHVSTSKKMIQNGGLVTQFMTKSKPDRENFPMRNKVVAGMSDAILVIESGLEGGSMITAEYANMYNKDVFAIPGRPSDEMNAGCNTLIKRHKAYLVETADDIAHFMNWKKESTKKDIQRSLFQDLNPSEQSIITLLKLNESISIDRIYNELHMSPSAMAGVLLEMEFKGLIKALPGKKYLLVV